MESVLAWRVGRMLCGGRKAATAWDGRLGSTDMDGLLGGVAPALM